MMNIDSHVIHKVVKAIALTTLKSIGYRPYNIGPITWSTLRKWPKKCPKLARKCPNLARIWQKTARKWPKFGQKVANFVPNGRIIKRHENLP